MTIDEKKFEALQLKDRGNKAFKKKDFSTALSSYSASIAYFKDPKVYSNRAAVFLKMKQYEECISDCNLALAMDKAFLKPYNRRAQANQALKNYKEAIDDYQFILSKDKKSKGVTKNLKKCREEYDKL